MRNFILRAIGILFSSPFFLFGMLIMIDGLRNPLNLEGTSGIGIYGKAGFGFFFATVGLMGLLISVRRFYKISDYLEPA